MANKHNHQGREWTFGEKWRCFAIMCTEHCFVDQSGKINLIWILIVFIVRFFLDQNQMLICESVVRCLSNYSVCGIPSEFPERACCQPASYPKNIRDFRWKFASFNQSGNFNRFHAQLSQQSSCGEAKLIKPMKKFLGK